MPDWWGNQTAMQLARVESKLDRLFSMLNTLLRQSNLMERQEMATQETLDRLTADVTANTNATASATAALTGFVKTVADLTAQLQTAVAGGDEDAIKAAADAIEANNTAMNAAIPQVASAVIANTPHK